MGCSAHGNPGLYVCDCKGEVLCDECVDDHNGLEHHKVAISEIAKVFP